MDDFDKHLPICCPNRFTKRIKEGDLDEDKFIAKGYADNFVKVDLVIDPDIIELLDSFEKVDLIIDQDVIELLDDFVKIDTPDTKNLDSFVLVGDKIPLNIQHVTRDQTVNGEYSWIAKINLW